MGAELIEKSFIPTYETNKSRTKILVCNNDINLENYSAILVAHDENGHITISDEKFKKEREVSFEKTRYPIFCLIYDRKSSKNTASNFKALINNLTQKINSATNPVKGLRDYHVINEEYFSTAFSNIAQCFSEEKNRGSAICLLQFAFHENPINIIKVCDFEKEILKRNELIGTLDKKIIELEEIKKQVGELIESEETNSIKKILLQKTNQLILELNGYKKDSKKISGPESSEAIENINRGFELITNNYKNLNGTLIKNKIILNERIKFATESLDKLEKFKEISYIDSIITYCLDSIEQIDLKKAIERNGELLLKIKQKPESFTNEDFERKKELHLAFLETLDLKKKEYDIADSKKNCIQETIQAIDVLEKKIKSTSNNLYGPALELFRIENFNGKLNEIKDNLIKLLKDEKQLSDCSFEAISEPFKNLQIHYDEKIKEITEISEKFKDRYKEIKINLDLLTQKIEDHTERLKGKKSISFRDKLINFIFKASTKEKIRLEEQAALSLGEIKNCIDKFSSSGNKNIGTLKKHFLDLDGILEDKSFTKHRGCLFFRFNPVTSKSIADDAMTCISEIKTELKV